MNLKITKNINQLLVVNLGDNRNSNCVDEASGDVTREKSLDIRYFLKFLNRISIVELCHDNLDYGKHPIKYINDTERDSLQRLRAIYFVMYFIDPQKSSRQGNN